MRKAFLSIALFILICWTANAQFQVQRQVVGTGGFIEQQVGNTFTMSGIFGQPVTGVIQPTVGGGTSTMYFGFWAPIPKPTSIEDEIFASEGIINYPNPVSNSTNFRFNLQEGSFVTLSVYNNLGGLVATVAQDMFLPAGQNSINWDISQTVGGTLNSGAYMYEMLVVPAGGSSKTHFLRNMLMISK